MPLIDMPIEQLHTYMGRNERPDDFDAYWDRALDELERLGIDYELAPATFAAPNSECFDLYFTGAGGARIHAIYLRPARRDEKLPAVVLFHGYSGDCGSFASKLNWTSAGFCCAALDCRGQGGASQDAGNVKGNTLQGHIIRGLDDPDPDKLYFRNVFLDTAQLARIVMSMDEVDEQRVGAHGGSQGGGLTLACAALTPALHSAAPQFPFLCDYRRVWEMDLASGAYEEISQYFRHFDPLHAREAEVFTKLGYIDAHNLASRIKSRVRMYVGLMDTICPPSTQFAAYNRIRSPKELRIYPDFAHESLPLSDDDVMAFMLEMAAAQQ